MNKREKVIAWAILLLMIVFVALAADPGDVSGEDGVDCNNDSIVVWENGSIACQDLNDTINNVAHVSGEMYNYTSGGWTFEINESGTYYFLTGLVEGDNNGFTLVSENSTHGGSYLTIDTAGLYDADAFLSFDVATVGGQYGFEIAKNFDENLQRNCYARDEGKGAVDNVAPTCLMNLVVGDNISLMVEDETSPPSDLIFYTINFNLKKIGNG